MPADNVNAAVHCRDGVTLTCHTDTYTPFGAEIFISNPGSAATMHAFFVAAENKDLIVLERGDTVGSYTGLLHSILQNRFKFLKGDALPDTHVGVTVNDIDMSRQWTGDEVCGLPEVWRRFAAERDELVTMRLAVITGP